VNDGFGNWSNVSKPHPQASAVKQFDQIRRNFIFTDFGGSRALDHDDGTCNVHNVCACFQTNPFSYYCTGSQFFRDEENVLVGAGVDTAKFMSLSVA
jgi:hypothetical protein